MRDKTCLRGEPLSWLSPLLLRCKILLRVSVALVVGLLNGLLTTTEAGEVLVAHQVLLLLLRRSYERIAVVEVLLL